LHGENLKAEDTFYYLALAAHIKKCHAAPVTLHITGRVAEGYLLQLQYLSL
jgi:hypothetical protein